LKGWIENVAARSPIWGDVDLKAFCRKTGYSREHATRELSKLRRESSLVFETKLRTKRGYGSKAWGVIVADPAKLAFDKHSLFYDSRGNPLHNYTTLAGGGEKIPPTITIAPRTRRRGRPRKHPHSSTVPKRSQGRPRKITQHPGATQPANPQSVKTVAPVSEKMAHEKSAKNARLCDNPKEEDSYGIQQKDSYGARRDMAQSRGMESENVRRKSHPRLRKKAFSMLEELADSHWDNCKVTFNRRTAFTFALNALNDGHDESRILACYADALFLCHGMAVDQAAGTGRVTFFNLSSTVTKAGELLAKDGLTRRERMANWYQKRTRNNSHGIDSETGIADLAQLRKKIAASLGIGGSA
jgi:hypothetical protein